MKKTWLFSLPIILIVLFISCSLENLLSNYPAGSTAALPADEINDTLRSFTGTFEYKTLLPVRLNLSLELYESTSGTEGTSSLQSLPPQEAVVIVTLHDSKGNLVYAGRIQSDGTLSTLLQLPAAPEDMTLTLHAEGFEERKVLIHDMVEYSEVKRTMGMLSQGINAKGGLTDSDGDLIPDVYDAFPSISELAFSYQTPAFGSLTIAFEDLYGHALAGDADYNDFIAKYVITEIANNGNQIKLIRVDAEAAAKIAGYNHKFGIRVDFFEGSADLTGNYIDEFGQSVPFTQTEVTAPINILLFASTKDAVGKTAYFELDFNSPQIIDPEDPALNYVDRPPYNPYIYVDDTQEDIHLIGEQDLSGSYDKSFQDTVGFPWALLVPADWIHPDECQRIEVHYPRFTLWRENFGTEHTDWYLHYDEPYEPESQVYAAGYYEGVSNDVACYWMDDSTGKIDLYDTTAARANSVFVAGSTVYVAGYINNGSNDVAGYWKDDGTSVTWTPLYDTANAQANAVYVDGSNVYVAGYYNNGSNDVAGYWKDDGTSISWTPLYSDADAEATDIVVSGGAVYVSGYYWDGANTKYVACYWQNGTKTDVEPTENSRAYGIAVSGSDVVYTAGFYFLAGNRACYWQGTTREDLSSSNSKAWDIALSGTEVYAAGYYDIAQGKSAACYWLNDASEVVDLYKDASYKAQARGIFLLGGDIYVAGYYDEGTQSACYWKNGSKLDLYSGARSIAYSLFVSD